MKILITCATGCIGGSLAKRLSSNANYSIVVTGRNASINENFQNHPIKVIQGDLAVQEFSNLATVSYTHLTLPTKA